MSKMLPAFTAETSLYKASQSYYMVGMNSQTEGAIHPEQFSAGQDCFGECLDFYHCSSLSDPQAKGDCFRHCRCQCFGINCPPQPPKCTTKTACCSPNLNPFAVCCPPGLMPGCVQVP
jgi:hypothetical protein